MNTSCCTNPIRINTLLIKNRIVFPAMCTKYAGPDGGVTERMLRYYEERAKGGAGLVTIEATSVDPTGNSFSRGLSIADDARLPGLTDLARRVKRHLHPAPARRARRAPPIFGPCRASRIRHPRRDPLRQQRDP